jgi:hypothetical protein
LHTFYPKSWMARCQPDRKCFERMSKLRFPGFDAVISNFGNFIHFVAKTLILELSQSTYICRCCCIEHCQ